MPQSASLASSIFPLSRYPALLRVLCLAGFLLSRGQGGVSSTEALPSGPPNSEHSQYLEAMSEGFLVTLNVPCSVGCVSLDETRPHLSPSRCLAHLVLENSDLALCASKAPTHSVSQMAPGQHSVQGVPDRRQSDAQPSVGLALHLPTIVLHICHFMSHCAGTSHSTPFTSGVPSSHRHSVLWAPLGSTEPLPSRLGWTTADARAGATGLLSG